MMRTILIALLSALLTVMPSIAHAAQYYIYNMEGSVERLVGNQWKPATKNEKVTLQDKFALKEGAMLAIGDKDTHRVYVTREMGVQNVAQIVQAARSQSSQTTRLALQKAVEASGKTTPRSVIMGVSYRAGTSAEELANDPNMKTYAAICQYLKKPKNAKTIQVLLTRVKENGFCYFSVDNQTDDLLYFNILALPRGDEKPYLSLDANSEDIIAVAPHATSTLTQYPFSDDDDLRYLLFASPEPFDAQMLNNLIRQQCTPTKGTKPLPLYFHMLY